MDLRQQASWRFQLAVDERGVQDQPCGIVGDLGIPPQFNLALQELEIPLDSVHANRERINEVEALGMLGKDRREIAAEGHVGAYENPQACGQAETERLVMGVANADREAASLHLGLQIENSKNLHAIVGSGIFFVHHGDVAKAQGFNQRLNDLVMRDRPVGCCCLGAGICANSVRPILDNGPATSVPVFILLFLSLFGVN